MRIACPTGAPIVAPIPHLPGSLMLSGEVAVTVGQANDLLLQRHDYRDVVMVFEALDGLIMGVMRQGGDIVPLTGSGVRAVDSTLDAHLWFHQWAMDGGRPRRFLRLLDDGQCAVGAWCIQAISTRYSMSHDPFVLMDIMENGARLVMGSVMLRAHRLAFPTPRLLHCGNPIATDIAMAELDGGTSVHGALGKAPGMLYRLERNGRVELVAQWVRPSYEPRFCGGRPVWNSSRWTFESEQN